MFAARTIVDAVRNLEKHDLADLTRLLRLERAQRAIRVAADEPKPAAAKAAVSRSAEKQKAR